nr:hypothetical protein [Tepidiforma sp.]
MGVAGGAEFAADLRPVGRAAGLDDFEIAVAEEAAAGGNRAEGSA